MECCPPHESLVLPCLQATFEPDLLLLAGILHLLHHIVRWPACHASTRVSDYWSQHQHQQLRMHSVHCTLVHLLPKASSLGFSIQRYCQVSIGPQFFASSAAMLRGTLSTWYRPVKRPHLYQVFISLISQGPVAWCMVQLLGQQEARASRF